MASKSTGCVVRRADNLKEVHELWWPLIQELQWDASENDLKTFWHTSSKHGIQVVHGKDDLATPVQGCAFAVEHDNSTAWIGYFLVKEAVRGRGWGAAVFQACLTAFESTACKYVGLDAVEAQVKTYERRMFKSLGVIRLMECESPREVVLTDQKGVEEVPWTLQDIRNADEEKLVSLEERYTGFRRSKVWCKEGLWHREKNDVFGFVASSASGEMQGVVLVRYSAKGYGVGPLYAPTEAMASSLLMRGMQQAVELDKDRTLSAEVYASNSSAQALFERHGWKWSGVDYDRMWLNGEAPPQQAPGGISEETCWAIFDAGQG